MLSSVPPTPHTAADDAHNTDKPSLALARGVKTLTSFQFLHKQLSLGFCLSLWVELIVSYGAPCSDSGRGQEASVKFPCRLGTV